MINKETFEKMKRSVSVIYPSKQGLVVNIALALFWDVACIAYLATLSEKLSPSLSDTHLFFLSLNFVLLLKYSLALIILLYINLSLLLSIYRLLIPLPSLKINDEGIEITPSLLPCKPITIAWVEIAAISFGRGCSKVSLAAFLTILQSFSYLSIDLVPEYEKLILARQPFFNKAFFQKGNSDLPMVIFIPRLLLPFSPKRFLAQLKNTYAAQLEQYSISIEDEGE
jgi:hypothetical protein